MFDADGSGSLSMAEFRNVLEMNGSNLTTTEISDLINEFDANGDGVLQIDEFIAAITGMNGGENEDREFKEIFEGMDVNGDGYISRDELKHAMVNMGERLSDEEIEDMLGEADTDGDGKIKLPEFIKLQKSMQ